MVQTPVYHSEYDLFCAVFIQGDVLHEIQIWNIFIKNTFFWLVIWTTCCSLFSHWNANGICFFVCVPLFHTIQLHICFVVIKIGEFDLWFICVRHKVINVSMSWWTMWQAAATFRIHCVYKTKSANNKCDYIQRLSVGRNRQKLFCVKTVAYKDRCNKLERVQRNRRRVVRLFSWLQLRRMQSISF